MKKKEKDSGDGERRSVERGEEREGGEEGGGGDMACQSNA